jgi:F-type H+-transporting ATPase subunit b
MEKLAEQTKTAEARIERAKAQALGDVRGIAADAVKAATQRLIGVAFDDSRVGSAVDQAMKGRA